MEDERLWFHVQCASAADASKNRGAISFILAVFMVSTLCLWIRRRAKPGKSQTAEGIGKREI